MEFPQAISNFMQNPWIVLIFMSFTPISILLAIIFFIKSRRKKSFIYYLRNDSLIKDFIQKIEGLNISYSGKNINTLTVTKIVFWNNGTDTIIRNDVPNNNIFSITIENDFDILDASIIQIVNQSNDVKISSSSNSKIINIDFDYFDKNEGFVLQLFHNGLDSDNIKINGAIKGFGEISKGRKNENIMQTITKESFSPIIISAIITFIIPRLLSFELHIVLSIIFIFVPFTVLLGYIKYKILYPVPKKLKKYFYSSVEQIILSYCT